MPLPILNYKPEPTQADLIRLFTRTSLHLAEQVGEMEQLDVGSAIANPDLPDVADANHVRDASLPEGVSPSEAVAQVEAHFADKKVRCHYWAMNPAAPTKQVEPLIAHLQSLGYQARVGEIWYLRHLPRVLMREVGGLKIIPARSAFAAARALAEEEAGETGVPKFADAALLRLDDPHYDAILALRDGRAIGAVAVLSVGELGRVNGLFVAPAFRGLGIGRTMLSRALEICARSLFKHVYIQLSPTAATAHGLCAKYGFEKIGQTAEWERR